MIIIYLTTERVTKFTKNPVCVWRLNNLWIYHLGFSHVKWNSFILKIWQADNGICGVAHYLNSSSHFPYMRNAGIAFSKINKVIRLFHVSLKFLYLTTHTVSWFWVAPKNWWSKYYFLKKNLLLDIFRILSLACEVLGYSHILFMILIACLHRGREIHINNEVHGF